MKKNNNLVIAVFLLAIPIVFTTACSKKKDNNTKTTIKSAQLQIVHATPKVGELQLEVDGKKTPHKVRYLNTSKPYAVIQTGNAAAITFLTASKYHNIARYPQF
ncbi:hypothetical protein [Chitinophaga sp. 212800010-3]|uniref:hypothetical protein n=1 Tax=unclassified Chitinophaga TaxID=2619133 RepID=UPI002DF62344|nr:hypothetical protein [Chitinophaga sp. 212800010-3]